MTTPTINHELLTSVFTRMCDDKTTWDEHAVLYLIETETVDEYHVSPLKVMTEGMIQVAARTGYPISVVLEQCADVVDFVTGLDPSTTPVTEGFTFLGLAFTCEAHKAPRITPGGPPIGQPSYSNDLADNPNSVEIFNITAVTVDQIIHSHTIEHHSTWSDRYCEPFTDDHKTARIPGALHRMTSTIHNAQKVSRG